MRARASCARRWPLSVLQVDVAAIASSECPGVASDPVACRGDALALVKVAVLHYRDEVVHRVIGCAAPLGELCPRLTRAQP